MTHSTLFYEFGDFALDVSGQRVFRRGEPSATPLTAKVFDTLLYLVEHPGETLSKEALLAAIWPGVIVEENSLTQNVSTLRQVLGEARGENRYIATVSRKGYRFVAKVTPCSDLETFHTPTETAATAPALSEQGVPLTRRPGVWTRWLRAGAALLIVSIAVTAAILLKPTRPPTAATQTLAILPFRPLLPAEKNESLELGMTESLISSLGQQGGRSIAPLSSVRRYSSPEQDPLAAGREFGVDTVLDGTLQRRGDRLRVSARLLRVSDGSQLWAQNFDQDFTTIFDVQDAIAAKVAKELSGNATAIASARSASNTKDPEAYALYTSGRFAWTRQSETSLMQAIGFFEQAVERDPNYALAYTGLADSYAVLGVFGIKAPHEVFPVARRAAEKALSIDPNLAAAHAALGHIKLQYDHDSSGAEREYERAVELDPTLALIHHRQGLLYAMQGDVDRALSASERAQRIEPLWLGARGAAANYLYYARRYDESIRSAEKVLALDDRADNARATLIRNLIVKGEFARAIEKYDERPLQTPGSNAFRAQALALAGRRAEAIAELDRVMKKSQQRYVAAYDIALIHAALGNTAQSLLWLERAVDDRSTLMVFLAQDPSFDALHTDPRFESVVRRVGVYTGALSR